MDIKALQTTLREFAAERDWRPFHTPKNLAMALMVEAAELAEIFQWMTPEQSRAAHADVVLQERIGDEAADVLLYLLQLADHTAVDLKRAVGRKLVKNARKYPPRRPGLPAGPTITADAQTHVLVDWENVQPKDTDIRTLAPDVTDVWLFHGPHQKKVDAHQDSFGERITLVPIARAGKNALDFHLSFYMGYIASRHPHARFVVISNDKGYAPMIEHATGLGFSARQVGFIQAEVAAKRAPSKTQAAKTAANSKDSGRQTTAKHPAAEPPPTAEKPASATPPAAKTVRPRKTASTKPAKTKTDISPPPSTTPPAKSPTVKAAPAKPVPSAKRTAPAKKTAVTPAATSAMREPENAMPPKPEDLRKALRHVEASIKKSANKPARQARLVASIKSLLGAAADDAVVQAVLRQLQDGGKVRIDGKGAVTYEL
ncbi:hypothetical protein GALL_183790 [mine drainage metagenome]|uniref:PIN-like domain-containing protein n=1 Tax=mine drainage metagenome TaxID=410659 RepID=A0A1J5SHL5_9ZZZZ